MAAENVDGAPLKPWETSSYNNFDKAFGDPDKAALFIKAGIDKVIGGRLLPDADQARAQLFATFNNALNFMTGEEVASIDKADRFVNALGGIRPKPVIIADPTMPRSRFLELMKGWGIPWHGAGARFSKEIAATIIYPPEVGCSIGEVVAHEQTHSGATLMGNLWEEGIAQLNGCLFSVLSGEDKPIVKTQPPFSVWDLGFLAMATLCSKNPEFYDATMEYKRTGTSDTLSNFLRQGFDLVGSARQFWHMQFSLPQDPHERYSSIPESLLDILPANALTHPSSLLNGILPHVEQKITDYEERMGYSFDFPAMATQLGSAAIRETITISEKSPEPGDDVTAALRRVIGTMKDSTD